TCSLGWSNHFRITGRINGAMNLLSSALQVAQEECLSREQAIALEYAGDCHLARREFRKAREKYQAALEIAEETAPAGDVVPELCHRIAETMIGMGDSNAAILICERGLRTARNAYDGYEECATHRVYAMAHAAAGNPSKALRIAEEG